MVTIFTFILFPFQWISIKEELIVTLKFHFLDQFKKMYKQKLKEQEKAYQRQVRQQRTSCHFSEI